MRTGSGVPFGMKCGRMRYLSAKYSASVRDTAIVAWGKWMAGYSQRCRM